MSDKYTGCSSFLTFRDEVTKWQNQEKTNADITTTMDIYAEATTEKKQEIMTNLQGKIIV